MDAKTHTYTSILNFILSKSMKPVLLILFALTITLSLAFAAEEVVDTNGNAISPGGRFCIMQAIGALGGGVKYAKTDNSMLGVPHQGGYIERETL